MRGERREEIGEMRNIYLLSPISSLLSHLTNTIPPPLYE